MSAFSGSPFGRVAPQGRLTLVTGTPFLISDQTAKTSIFYTPYAGDLLPLYTDSGWAMQQFGELTEALDTSNHLSTNLYDLFAFDNGGTLAIGSGPAWSSDTARGTGAGTTELELLNGLYVNKNSITLKNGAGAGVAGIAARKATYLGTFYATANGQTGMAFQPAAAAGGTNNILGLYNAHNRIRCAALCRDNTNSWTYATATWRANNNSNSNRVSFVDGLQRSAIATRVAATLTTSSISVENFMGVAIGSTSATPAKSVGCAGSASAVGVSVDVTYQPILGFSYAQAVEYSTGATGTFYGSVNSIQQHALEVSLEM